MSKNVVELRRAPVARRSHMDTIIISMSVVSQWKIPPFQRPLHINEKVRMIAAEIEADEVIPGVLTVGHVEGDSNTYVIDGQHRIEAFRLSNIKEAIADVRIIKYGSMAEMGEDFVNLNSHIVTLKPDDILRGLEESTPVLAMIREKCPFVGYGQVRRGDNTSILSMSVVIRNWAGSASDTPATMSRSAASLVREMHEDETKQLTDFLGLAFAAWGRGVDVQRLWGSLNLSLCMWLWRRLVVNTERRGNLRYTVLKPGHFRQCLMALGASSDYNDWLLGRNNCERDRSPCYNRIKLLFAGRIRDEQLTSNTKLPQPAWDG